MLPKDNLEGVYLTYLAPIHLEETATIEIVKRIKEANCWSSDLDKFRQMAQDRGSSRQTLLDRLLLNEGRHEVPN